MQSERITILASPAAKRTIAERASARGLSIGEYVRRRAIDDDDMSPEQEAELAALVEEVNAAVPRMLEMLDVMSAAVQKLREENDAFFREKGLR